MNPTSPAATVLDEVATWAGITTQPTARGATASEGGVSVAPARATPNLSLQELSSGWWRSNVLERVTAGATRRRACP
jgi:hypothetical protein